jgi:hypothetical protein
VTRPARNRLLIAAFWLGFLVLGNVLWAPLRVPVVLLLLALSLASFIVSRDFFAGRRAMRRKEWVDALVAFERFETQLQLPGRRRFSWLASGIYSFNAAAIARNNCGVVHLENGKLDLADAKRLGLSNRKAHAKVRAALQVLNETAAR